MDECTTLTPLPDAVPVTARVAILVGPGRNPGPDLIPDLEPDVLSCGL